MSLAKLLTIFKKKPPIKISYPKPLSVNNPVYPRRIWTEPGTYAREGATGINVIYGGKIWSFGAKGFYDIVDRCLSDIYWTISGRHVIDTIIDKTAGDRRVEIVPGRSNFCAGGGSDGGLPLYVSFTNSTEFDKITEMKNALRNANFLNRRGYVWLANNISKMRAYTFEKYTMVPINITADDVQAWFESNDPDHHIYKCLGPNVNDAMRESLELRIIISLYDWARSNEGGGSCINFDPNKMGGRDNHRPPAIALAHELIHSYYYICGRQPGQDINHYTTMLFEYLCVGLGPWLNKSPRNGQDNVHENNIRDEWIPNFGGWKNTFVPDLRMRY